MKYDAAGQLICEKNQMGESRYYTYNLLGKVESMIDEAGRKTEYKYLPGGLLEAVIYLGEIVEKYTYDGNSNVKTYTNNEGLKLTYSYDSLNRITSIEGSGGEKNTYAYDVMGNIISMTDGLGNITKYEYTLTGRLSRVINPLNDVTEYAYDECDNLIEICQYGKKEDGEKECHITRYERDLLGYVRTITDPLGLKEHYKYDSKGQLLEKIDKEGYLTRYGYTSQGDINHIQYADGREVKLSYNPLRQLQELEDWLGTMKIETDLLGRAAKILYQDGKEVSYTYGKAGERTSITYPNGEKVFYNYNEDFRLSELKADNQVIKYEYDKAGRMIKKSFPNQMETAYCYNARGQIEQLAHMDKEGIIDKFTYQYDSLGNKTVVNKERRGMPEENGIYTYQYDPVGRVKSVAKNATVLKTYTYDAFGNRTKLVEEGTETLYTYNAVNQLVFKRDNSGETKYTFDKRGNLTQILENGNVKNQYYYGSVNRLERAINRDGETAQYRYNGMGYRIGKEVESVNSKRAIQYTIDLTKQYYNLLQKEDAENIQTYYWDGNVVGMFDHDMPRCSYYLQDEMGSPVRLAYANGDFLESYGYDEFGQDLYGNQGILQPFGYTGYQYDNIAETYFAQAREYDCKNGRFSSIDPYKGVLYKGDTINNYLYCINNPLLYFDPLGLAPAWLEGIFAHIQIELDLSIRQFSCEHTECNIRIPGAGLGKTGLGIADFLVDKGDRVEIYEIKPESWASGYRNRLAREQLNRYVSNYRINTGIRTTEGTQIFSNSLPYSMDPTRTLNYWSNGDGIIYYKIESKPEPEPKRLPIAVPRHQLDYRLVNERSTESSPRRRELSRLETLSGYQGNLETEISFIIIGKCILGCVFTIGTIVEVVFTGGAGVADDIAIPATWAWALAP